MSIKAGFAGSGFVAEIHADAVSRVGSTDVKLEGVYSPTKENREEFAEEQGTKAFGSLEELLDSVDVVHVCAPTAEHERVAKEVLDRDKSVIVEKPLTGYHGEDHEDFNGDTFPKQDALDKAIDSVQRLIEAEGKSEGQILYAENWVYAPSIQKEVEILRKSEGQIIWMHGEESHSGSHSEDYAYWSRSGGGVMMMKGVHPLTAALYLKRVEGQVRYGEPIRPAAVSSRAHALTRKEKFEDAGHIRCDYHDIDDYSGQHIIFEDGMVADIFAHDVVMGGIHNMIEVNANNHRTICNINPNTAMQTYTPDKKYFNDIYTVEKEETPEGWSFTSPDEHWFTGYPQEIEAFYENVVEGTKPESDLSLAGDCIATTYSSYVSDEQGGKEVKVELPWD
jgi:predicted dehydrogenase